MDDVREPLTAAQWAAWVLVGDPHGRIPEALGAMAGRIASAVAQARAAVPAGEAAAEPRALVQARARLARLSGRERQTLAGLAAARSYKELSRELGLSVKTLETYRARLIAKLGLRNKAELLRLAVDAGLLAPETPP